MAVTETRNAVDFVWILKDTSDVLYPKAEKRVLVIENLILAALLASVAKQCVDNQEMSA